MGSDQSVHRLIRFDGDRMWDFFSDGRNNICYRTLEGNMGWMGPHLVSENAKNEFGVCVDEHGGLHFIYLSLEGGITYMHYDDKGWSEQKLSEYNVKEYDIRYPAVIALDNRIHIIFAVGDPWEAEIWSLYHYCWDGKLWVHQRISEFIDDWESAPYSYRIYDNSIHLSYREVSGSISKVLHVKYHTDLQKWLALPNNPYAGADIGDNSSPEPSIYEDALEWINKAQAVYRDHLSIARETDELHRRSMETKRRWELILEELDDFKIKIRKMQNKGPLKRLFGSMLH